MYIAPRTSHLTFSQLSDTLSIAAVITVLHLQHKDFLHFGRTLYTTMIGMITLALCTWMCAGGSPTLGCRPVGSVGVGTPISWALTLWLPDCRGCNRLARYILLLASPVREREDTVLHVCELYQYHDCIYIHQYIDCMCMYTCVYIHVHVHVYTCRWSHECDHSR